MQNQFSLFRLIAICLIISIVQDEQYWPNPKHFDPERFNDENRKSIQTGTYLPFGKFY